MRTILYPSGKLPEPVTHNTRDIEHTLVIVSLVLILFFVVYIIYHFSKTSSQIFIQCHPGECSVNLSSGETICPVDPNSALEIDPKFFGCTARSFCTSGAVPYSINSDGSTNYQGNCENSFCRCLNQGSCPYFAEVLFQVNGNVIGVNGNTLNSINTNISYVQVPNQSPLRGGDSPELKNVANETCLITLSNASFLTPGGCPPFNPDDIDGMKKCIDFNPCITGRLTYVPPKDRDLNLTPFDMTRDALTMSMACVSGPVCGANEVPIYSWKSAKTVCNSI